MVASNALAANAAFFASLEALLQEPDLSPEDAQVIIQIATYFALRRETGFYSSAVLEASFLVQAASFPSLSVPMAEGTLCVMTQAHSEGGHPQMVLRMAQLLKNYAPYSLVLTGQEHKPLPASIRAAFESSGGTVTLLPSGLSVFEKGRMLREHGMMRERVMLATHMDDASPIVAFGHPDFPRPVFLFNHADFLFWIGRSVCDAVLEYRALGQEISRCYRGEPAAWRVPLPFEQLPASAEDKQTVRTRLGLPVGRSILLTVGSSYKFTPIGTFDFRLLLKELFCRIPDSHHVIIGPSPSDPFWKKEVSNYAGRLHVMGIVQREQLPPWIKAADLYVDSMPFCGGIAVLDAVQLGLPVAGLETLGCPMGFIRESGMLFESIAELIRAIAPLLSDEHSRITLHEKQFLLAEREHSLQNWGAKLQEAVNSVRRHSVTQGWKRDSACTEYEEFKNHLLSSMTRFPTLRLLAKIVLLTRKMNSLPLQKAIVGSLVKQVLHGLR